MSPLCIIPFVYALIRFFFCELWPLRFVVDVADVLTYEGRKGGARQFSGVRVKKRRGAPVFEEGRRLFRYDFKGGIKVCFWSRERERGGGKENKLLKYV